MEDIEDMQTAFTLLRMFAGVSNILDLLRLISPRLSLPFAKQFDSLTASSLRRLAGEVLAEDCIGELRVPLNFSEQSFGIGLTAAVDIAAPSFLGSTNQVEFRLSRILPPHTLTPLEDPDVLAALTAWSDLVPTPAAFPSQISCATSTLNASSRNRCSAAVSMPSTSVMPEPGLFVCP